MLDNSIDDAYKVAPSRERELKLVSRPYVYNIHLSRSFTGAWIETRRCLCPTACREVAPSRERELKPLYGCKKYFAKISRSFTGAWIETSRRGAQGTRHKVAPSRERELKHRISGARRKNRPWSLLHGSVNWNQPIDGIHLKTLTSLLHGSVNWNNVLYAKYRKICVAPSRERELKPTGGKKILWILQVAPSRERELKLFSLCLVCPLCVAPSRERELKPCALCLVCPPMRVAPSRERELKRLWRFSDSGYSEVAPSRERELKHRFPGCSGAKKSSLLHGSVNWNYFPCALCPPLCESLLHGSVNWNAKILD